MSFKKDVLKKLDSITEQQHKHTVELTLNTKILTDHHVRTSQLEARVVPLEKSHIFFNQLSKVIAGLVAVGAGLAAIYSYLLIK